MKMVVAIIKPFRIEDVRIALYKLGIEGMTVTEVKGFGRQKGNAQDHNGENHEVKFLPKVKLEVAIPSELESKAIKAIENAANTGRVGDGKIFVYDLCHTVRIRTGETGTDAI